MFWIMLIARDKSASIDDSVIAWVGGLRKEK